MTTPTPPRPRRRRWFVVAAILVALVPAALLLRSRHDPRFIGHWSYKADRSPSPTAQFVFLENGTGWSAPPSSPITSSLRWHTAGSWLFLDDPPRDNLTRAYQHVAHVVTQLTGIEPRGPVECQKILQIEENTIRVQDSTGNGTLQRITD